MILNVVSACSASRRRSMVSMAVLSTDTLLRVSRIQTALSRTQRIILLSQVTVNRPVCKNGVSQPFPSLPPPRTLFPSGAPSVSSAWECRDIKIQDTNAMLIVIRNTVKLNKLDKLELEDKRKEMLRVYRPKLGNWHITHSHGSARVL